VFGVVVGHVKEGAVDAVQCPAEVARVGEVASDDLDTVGELRCGGVANQGPEVVSGTGQVVKKRATYLAGGAGDQQTHEVLLAGSGAVALSRRRVVVRRQVGWPAAWLADRLRLRRLAAWRESAGELVPLTVSLLRSAA